MAALWIDFRAATSSRMRLAGWLLLGGGVLFVIVLAQLQSDADARVERLRLREEHLTRLSHPARRTTTSISDAEQQRQLARANTLITRLALPWDDLFDAIEQVGTRWSDAPQSINRTALLADMPDARQHALHISTSMTPLASQPQALPQNGLALAQRAANGGDKSVSGQHQIALLEITPDVANHQVRISGEAKTLEDVLAYVEKLKARPVFARIHLTAYDTVQRAGANVILFNLAMVWKQP